MANVIALHPFTRRALTSLRGSLLRAGFNLQVTSAYRSLQHQAQLFKEWEQGRRKLPVAEPGTSTHNFGFAIDVLSDAPLPFLVALAAEQGLRWAGPRDPVHFDPFGPPLWRAILSELLIA